jgi:hypothetical protein
VLVLAGAAAAIVGAVGGTSVRAPVALAVPANPDGLIAGAPLQRAECSNWLAAGPADRALAVSALAAAVGAPTEYRGVRGTALTEAQAYQLLDSSCAGPISRHFLLYQLYIRAAAFRSMWASP